jgi:hypothetical protein
MFYKTRAKAFIKSFEVIPVDHPNIKLLLDEHLAECQAAGVAAATAAGTFMIKIFASWTLSEKAHLNERAEQGIARLKEELPPEMVDLLLAQQLKVLEAC